MFSQQLAIPSVFGCAYCPVKDFPCLGSLWLCLREVATSCFACVLDQPILLCKWKSKWSGPSASQSFAMCLCMTLTWCPGMLLGHPRLFPNPEKCFSKQEISPSSYATSHFAPYIPPVWVLTWQLLTVYAPASSMSAYQIFS